MSERVGIDTDLAPSAPTGLTSEEAERRHHEGLGNEIEQQTARSIGSIVRANTLTRFNAIVTSLVVVVLVFGDPIDAVFGLVMVLNSVIGLVQEIRAKRSLDALQVLLVPSIGVVRDGTVVRLAPEDMVVDDVFELEPGDQIPVDGSVLDSAGLEVDESALTGESQPIPKPAGAEILSGSVVVVGSATALATRVGAESWAHQLTKEAKHFVLTQSELRVGIDRLLTVISFILPPLSALLVWSQLRTDAGFAEGIIAAVAGVIALVPQGLVLLVSMTFAIAVLRLAQEKVVVQELPAVEGLARVDMLCVDKTGTLTTGSLAVDRLEPIASTDSEFLAGWGADVLRIDPLDWDEDVVAMEVTLGKRCAGLDLRGDSFERALLPAHPAAGRGAATRAERLCPGCRRSPGSLRRRLRNATRRVRTRGPGSGGVSAALRPRAARPAAVWRAPDCAWSGRARRKKRLRAGFMVSDTTQGSA